MSSSPSIAAIDVAPATRCQSIRHRCPTARACLLPRAGVLPELIPHDLVHSLPAEGLVDLLGRDGPVGKGVEDPLLVRQDLHDSLVDGIRAEQPMDKDLPRLSHVISAGDSLVLRHRAVWRVRPQSGQSTPDGKQSMALWQRELGLRVRPARKSSSQRLSHERLAGLREIVIDPVRRSLAYEEFRLKEFERDRDGTWVDEIPDENDHSIDAVRYAMMDDMLRGA